MLTNKKKAFTIIELLVVVSIIALLIGILLPAIGKARDRAHQTRSMANLRQLGQAHASYAAEWNDNQWTTGPHNLATYGNSLNDAVEGFKKAFGGNPKSVSFCEGDLACVRLGFAYSEAKGQQEYYWADTPNNSHNAIIPMGFEPGQTRRFGYFRMINSKPFNVYLAGRVYDSTLFAPKDRVPLSAIGECWDAAGEYCALTGGSHGPVSSSYILSPAALYTPSLFSGGFVLTRIYTTPASFRTPPMGHARYPDLKTHMLEHHWLQRTRRDCIPGAPAAIAEYEGCAPYFFNASQDSNPATLFYDGHVDMLSVREAVQANLQAVSSGDGEAKYSLWNNGTPLGGNWQGGKTGGYYHDQVYMRPGENQGSLRYSSFHILTRHGILGRDTFSR